MKTAHALKAAGVFQHEAPAIELCSDFSTTCVEVTRHHYEHILELTTDKVQFRVFSRNSLPRLQKNQWQTPLRP